MRGRIGYLRAALAGAAMAIASTNTSKIFDDDYRVWWIVSATLFTAAVTIVCAGSRLALRLVCEAGAVLAATFATLSLAQGSAGADGTHIVSGLRDLLATRWPAPVIPAGVAALVLLTSAGTAYAVDAAARRQVGVALLPSIGLLVLTAVLAPKAGAPSGGLLAGYVLCALCLMLGRVRVRGNPHLLARLTGIFVVVVSIPLLLADATAGDRYDVRRHIEPEVTSFSGISPLSQLDEWRNLTPVATMFTSTLSRPQRWRVVGLTRYDGRTWMPSDDYRRASSELRVADGSRAREHIDVALDQLDSPWLPAPDRTVGTSARVRTDGETSSLLNDDLAHPARTYSLTIEAPSGSTPGLAADSVDASSPFIGGFAVTEAVRALADTIVEGATSDAERAQRIATYLHDRYTLDRSSPPGHSFAVEELFLIQTKRGRDEQFVAAYAILAAQAGLPVRISIGFDASVNAAGTTVAGSNQAVAWPEVKFEGAGWVAFDPLPEAKVATQPRAVPVAPPPEPSTPDPEAVPPTTATPPSSTTPDTAVDPPPAASPGTSRGLSSRMLGGLAGSGLLLGIILYVVIVSRLKRVRRAQLEQDEDPRRRVVGAFRAGSDLLTDLGAPTSAALTDRELAERGVAVVGPASSNLRRVATLSTEAVYAPTVPGPDQTGEAWQQIDEFQRASADHVGLLRYLRARLSLRSLRHRLPD